MKTDEILNYYPVVYGFVNTKSLLTFHSVQSIFLFSRRADSHWSWLISLKTCLQPQMDHDHITLFSFPQRVHSEQKQDICVKRHGMDVDIVSARFKPRVKVWNDALLHNFLIIFSKLFCLSLYMSCISEKQLKVTSSAFFVHLKNIQVSFTWQKKNTASSNWQGGTKGIFYNLFNTWHTWLPWWWSTSRLLFQI